MNIRERIGRFLLEFVIPPSAYFRYLLHKERKRQREECAKLTLDELVQRYNEAKTALLEMWGKDQ